MTAQLISADIYHKAPGVPLDGLGQQQRERVQVLLVSAHYCLK